MTRSDVEREHTVKDGIIASKGKFEGEPVWAPWFWDEAMNGRADAEIDDPTGWLGHFNFNITDKHRQLFPELGRIKAITLAELDNGDVVTTTQE